MLIEKKQATDLLPADYNPRKDLKPGDTEYEKLKRSLEQFGYVEPVIWNKTTGRVVGGHQRLKVLIDLGITEIDCVVVELDEEREKALNVALNKISGDWDKDKLALLISDLQGADFDVSLTGFEPSEIDALFKDTLQGGVKEDDFDVDAELENPAFSKAGDIWRLGRHTLVCGDSTKPETYDALLGSTKVNLVITDPPYNVDYTGGTKDHLKIEGDAQSPEAFATFLLQAFKAAEAVMKPGAAFYIWHPDLGGLTFRDAILRAGLTVRQCLIWNKNALVLGRQDYQWKHEPCLYGWKDGAAHYFDESRSEATVIPDGEEVDPKKLKKEELVALCTKLLAEDRKTTVIDEDKPSRSEEHPTMKPIRLMARLIKNSTRPDETVLDTFGGSGSTLIACEQLRRRCCMMEIDPRYCDVIITRWETLTGGKAVLLDV